MQRESTSTQNTGMGSAAQGGQERQQPAGQAYGGQQGGSAGQQHGQQSQQRNVQGEMAGRGGSQGQGVQVGQRGGSPQRAGLQRYNRDPLSVVQQLSEEMDQLFDTFLYGRPLTAQRARRSDLQTLWAPEMEVREEGNQLRICVDLPGVPKDKVKVDIEDGALTIQGERSEERQEGGEQQGFRRSERRYGSFFRSIALPEATDTSQAKATMKDGVLEIILPIEQRRQAQRLEIQD